MTFLEMQNFVLSDRFGSGKRADSKRWINHRYGRMWAQEPWSFKMGFVDFNVPMGDDSVALGTLQRVHAFKDSTTSPSYLPVEALRPEGFMDDLSAQAGIPYSFTIVNNVIYFDRPNTSERTFRALGELKWVSLSADGDTPLVPEEFHETICHGAISEGLRLENDPSWSAAEQDFLSGIQDMRRSYLAQVMITSDFSPSWP